VSELKANDKGIIAPDTYTLREKRRLKAQSRHKRIVRARKIKARKVSALIIFALLLGLQFTHQEFPQAAAVEIPKTSVGNSLRFQQAFLRTDAIFYAMGKVSAAQWPCLETLWRKESNWRYWAKNKNSTAYGIPQGLTLNRNWAPRAQVDWGLKYINERYGTPCAALNFHDREGYY
jgi:hypothetical protein